MQPPDALLKKGITSLPTIGDGRQSGTADSPSILNASPESAAGGGLAWLRTGDVIRIDFNKGECNALVPDEELAARKADGIPAVHALAAHLSSVGDPAFGRRGSGRSCGFPPDRREDAPAQSLIAPDKNPRPRPGIFPFGLFRI
jgi:hypothetical protein